MTRGRLIDFQRLTKKKKLTTQVPQLSSRVVALPVCRTYRRAVVAMVLPNEIARAADDGDVDVVRAFLAQHPERVDDVNDGDRTLLQLASLPIGEERERRSLELVQLLVTAGANVDRRLNPEHEGPTELHQACILRCPGLLQVLVRAGADVTLVTRGPAATSTRLTDWQKYCLVPPKELLRLRSQIARGKVEATRATPPHLARLFARSLPNEIAWRVLAFWSPRY